MVIGNRSPSIAPFLASIALGGILIFLTQRMKNRGNKGSLSESDKTDLSYMGEAAVTTSKRAGPIIDKVQNFARPILTQCKSWPWTAGYLLSTTIYFISMLISEGFTHPLDNPGFGPSAVGLSTFGINNPALIIYRMEHFRLISSSFLCSGVTTYLFMAYTLYKTGVEGAMANYNHPHWHFPLVASMLSCAINLLYACIGNGASASSLSLALGLNAFSSAMRRQSDAYPSPLCFPVIIFILGCTPLFPFDSLVSLTSAGITGMIIGLALFTEEPVEMSEAGDVYHNESIANGEEPTEKRAHHVRWKFVNGTGVVYVIMYLLILFRVPSPDKQNMYPYLTGCGLVYSDQVGDFVDAYANDANGGRALQDDNGEDWFDGQNMCAQMCIPHLVYWPALWGAQKFASVPLIGGTCEDNGYDAHIADKTFHEYSVVFEVQLFTASNSDE